MNLGIGQILLSGYLKLNDIPRREYIPYNYNYALSLWTYIYGTGNINSSFTEYTPIMDYGENQLSYIG